MNANGHLVLVESADVARSIGRPGLLEARLEAVGSDATVIRESAGRFDVLAQRLGAGGVPDVPVPSGLESWFADQFTTTLGEPGLLMAVLSLREELAADVWRHPVEGWLVQPPAGFERSWTAEQRTWLARELSPEPQPTPDASMGHFRTIADALDEAAVVVVFNVSTYDPAGVRYDFTEDAYPVLAHRYDLALELTAAEIGAAMIDVDRTIAEFGGARAVEGIAAYTVEASAVIAEDALHAINQLGVSGLSLEGDVMRLDVPAYDRRTTRGRIDTWHVTPGSDVTRGSPLFDLTFDNLVHRLDYAAQETNRSMSLTVLAADDGRIARVDVTGGAEVEVGQTVGVVVADDTVAAPPTEELGEGAPPFRVGIRVK